VVERVIQANAVEAPAHLRLEASQEVELGLTVLRLHPRGPERALGGEHVSGGDRQHRRCEQDGARRTSDRTSSPASSGHAEDPLA